MAALNSGKTGSLASDATELMACTDAAEATGEFTSLSAVDATREFATSPATDAEDRTAEFVVNGPQPSGQPASTVAFAPGSPLSMVAVREGSSNPSSDDETDRVSSASHRFRIIRKHAKGGLGQVLLAHDEELCRDVALKEILEQFSGNRESQSRFVVEAQITAALQHPGIVPIYGFGTYSDGRPFYAMRFIDGESLEDVAKRFHERRAAMGPGKATVELRQLIGSLINVCYTIEYAHSRGILHRDIKPANIMLGKFGEALVVDWGIAKLMNQPLSESGVEEGSVRLAAADNTEATMEGTAKGTMQYMSPEQARGEVDQLGPATDIYSLGATLFFILTGQGRFGGRMRFNELLAKLNAGDYPSPRQLDRSIPRPLEAICMKAMSPARTDRYSSARALSSDLERWLADEPVSAHRESRSEQAMRWLRHHRSWAQASLAILVSVTLVSVVAAVLVNQARQREMLARQESEKQRTLADENYQHARAAVEQFFTHVSESTLLNVPGMQGLRRELLQIALNYEQRFLAQRGDDPSQRREVAEACFRAALATAAINSGAAALPLFERARQIQEQLLRESPNDSELRYALSNTYNEIGREAYQIGRYSEALDWFHKSLNKRQELVERDQDNLEYQRKLASSKNNLGVISQKSGEAEQALARYTEAIDLGKKLVAQDAEHELYRRDLARNRYNLGLLAKERGESEAAVENLQLAGAEFERLAVQFKLVTEYGQQAGLCYQLLGDLHLKADRYLEAAQWLQKARDIQEPLAYRNPELIQLAADQAVTYSRLAEWCERQEYLDVALQWTEETARVLRPLVKSGVQDIRIYTDLAGNQARTGTLKMALNDNEAALSALKEAYEMYRILETEMLKTDPDAEAQKLKVSAEIATCLTNSGLAQSRQGDQAAARQMLEKARVRYESLLARPGQSTSAKALLEDRRALCYANLGQVEQASQNWDAAQQNYERARKIHEQYLDDAATGSLQRIHLTEVLLLIAQTETQQQRTEAAVETYQTMSDTIRVLIDQGDERPQPLKLSAAAAHGRGAILLAQEMNQQALAAYQEAVNQQRQAFEKSSGATLYRQTLDTYLVDLALVQKSSGLTADAAATIRKREELWPDDGAQLFNIAKDLATIALRDPAELSDTEKTEQESFIAAVIALLRDARKAGLQDLSSAAADPAFARLSEEPRFRQLVYGGD